MKPSLTIHSDPDSQGRTLFTAEWDCSYFPGDPAGGAMNYLSLFSGAGGGDLAMQHLLGFKCLGYVEYENFCQKVIRQRISDGLLDPAPIFGDIRQFISEGYAKSYFGMVDLVTGGPPCQPFSVAGKRAGRQDERNMWPEMRDVIRTIRPRFAFIENVPGLLNSGYFGTILSDLHESGFAEIRWITLGADDVGAPHRRKRVWILAYAESKRSLRETGGICDKDGRQRGTLFWESIIASDVADAPNRKDDGRERGSLDVAERGRECVNPSTDPCREDVADSSRILEGRKEQWPERERAGVCGECRKWDEDPACTCGTGVICYKHCEMADADEAGRREQRRAEPVQQEYGPPKCGGSWWAIDPADLADTVKGGSQDGWSEGKCENQHPRDENNGSEAKELCGEGRPAQPRLGLLVDGMADRLDLSSTPFKRNIPRVANGVPNRVDRLKAIGNGQVSLTAAEAWKILAGEYRQGRRGQVFHANLEEFKERHADDFNLFPKG